MLVLTVAAASGCGTSEKAEQSVAAKPKTVSVAAATKDFKAAVDTFDTDGGCLEQAAGTCWSEMTAVMGPARTLRKAMNSDKTVGPEFWTGAYALIDTMENGIAVGEDKGAGTFSNRPDVLGSAHKLADWLDEHPTS
ncbi:hypothetical protein ABZV65_30835 [Streptomyces bauhiniae]|uniref:hypothetical protein n=1 Tax=Streptomyces bauhiniae TaxID=2340725 RepID=UPI0033A4937A